MKQLESYMAKKNFLLLVVSFGFEAAELGSQIIFFVFLFFVKYNIHIL